MATTVTYMDPQGVGRKILATSHSVTQASHGFSVGDMIRYSGSAWVKSKADVAANSEVDACVSSVAGADDFVYALPFCELDIFTGLTAGTTYFLSAATSGAYTATEPTTADNVSKPVLRALTTTRAEFIWARGVEIPGYPTTATVTSSPYNALTTDTIIVSNPSPGAAITINLPAGASHLTGQVIIKDKANTATTNLITIVANGSETIDGSGTIYINTDRGSKLLVFVGTEWSVV